MTETPLLRDVIDIPERAGAEDYVLRLTDSVGQDVVARTLDDYVVTPDLADAFDAALGRVAEAVRTGESRGAFLVGSFGSGKSHFMAVLHALLSGAPAARSKPELAPVITRHDPVLQQRSILPLAFHLIGADSLEQAIFSGYLHQIRQRHPEAPLPAVHQTDTLFADAERLRATLGDERFFAGLNGDADAEATAPTTPAGPATHEPSTPKPSANVWAAFVGGDAWTADSYAAARAAAPGHDTRQRLATALVDSYFRSYTGHAEYVDLDTGLTALANHAKDLGYDAVVLFLDELVLWLAFNVGDRSLFGREAQKITKLVESSHGRRPIPLVSFVARQMDLRRWLADSGASGADQEALESAFKHQEGRFPQISLGDDNLPYVASRRLLAPKDDTAQAILAEAFARIDRDPQVWDVLLDGINTDDSHRGADEAAFRLTYPFSPALVSTLRSLSGVMQRERTALKVMQQMLVDRRDTLTVDDLVAVGDAFGYLVEGANVLDAKSAALFSSARKLWAEKLQPLLQRNHEVTDAVASGPREDLPAAYRADDRLAKTLLLSAVAPNVPALKALTGARLASLNHGSIRSPVPRGEAQVVLSKVRSWAREVPEIHLDGGELNPTVRLQLADVDYESIVERAKGEDNEGRRRELVKQLVAESIGLPLSAQDMQGAYSHKVIWRGSQRHVDVLFGNVRDSGWLPDEHFIANAGTWRFIIDHPFDEPGHSAAEDQRRLDEMRAREIESHTIVWMPRFLAPERIAELRRLAILTWLLDGTGERWENHANHLGETDRAQAKSILQSQRNTLRHSLLDAIQQSYGAATPRRGTLVDDPGHVQVLWSLDRALELQSPVGANLRQAFEHLIDQAFSTTYPAHPRFEPGDVEVKVGQLRTVADHVHRAAQDREKRVDYEGDHAAVRRIAGPLGVGTASEMYYLLGDDRFPWGAEIEKGLGAREQASGIPAADPVDVRELRAWIDAVTPAVGLRPEVADLVIITWAALRQRAWYGHGVALPEPPHPGSVHDTMQLRTQPMPGAAEWTQAINTAAHLFGIKTSQHLTGPAVATLVGQTHEHAQKYAATAPRLVTALDAAYGYAGIESTEDRPTRRRTARTTSAFVQRLRQLTGVPVVTALAEADFGTTLDAAGRSLTQSAQVAAALESFAWERLRPLHEASAGEGAHADQAAAILHELRQALLADELAQPLPAALRRTDDAIFAWLASNAAASSPPAPASAPEPAVPVRPADTRGSGSATRVAGSADDEVLRRLRGFLDEHRDADVEVHWRVRE